MLQKLVAIAKQIDELKINQFAWVFFAAHHVLSTLLVGFLETIIGFVTVFNDECIDTTLTLSFIGIHFLLSFDDLVTDSFESVLEKVADFVERLCFLNKACRRGLSANIVEASRLRDSSHGDGLEGAESALVTHDSLEDVLREIVDHGLRLDGAV